MLISLNWIKDFVDLPQMPAKELGSQFTLATAEVEDIKEVGDSLRPILCVEIKSVRPHPDSDKLNLVTFDLGSSQLKEVVCGAPNVRPDLKVPYAPIGTTLPNGMTLEPKKIRGILSDGMLCSEVELGLGEGKAGLMELRSEVKPGTPLPEYLELESDVILDVDNKSLTHRPDLWGYIGLAREFAASHKMPLKYRFTPEWEISIEARFSNDTAPVDIEVSADSACFAYYGLSMEIAKMGETPAWLKNRLEAVGSRSINLIVDISNYVMIEMGMPNHIFDRSKIAGNKVIVKHAGEPLKFKTLDEVVRDVVPSDTIIGDIHKPLVLAGIMGGLESGVEAATTKIFLEAANWDAPEIRKTSVRLGLRTDSSQRYEKTLDSNLCYRTLLRLVELISELSPGAKVIGRPVKYVNEAKLSKPLDLTISYHQINTSLGMVIPLATIKDIFERLDFEVSESNEVFKITVPSYRTTKDISCNADLVEEIGRMIGYDNISPVSPLLPVKPVRLSSSKQFHRKLQDFLVQQGKSLQVMTYPMVGKDLLQKAFWPLNNEHLILVNALSVEQDRMRPSMIPSAIELAFLNQKNYEAFSFFEIGRSYLDYEKERSQVVIGMYAKEQSPFLQLENLTEKLLTSLNVNFAFTGRNEKFPNPLIPTEWPGIHPHEFVNIQVMGKFAGAITTVHPLVMRNFKMKGYLSLAVVDMTEFEAKETKEKFKFKPLSKFPSASFDFTVVTQKDVPAASVLTVLNSLKIKELKAKSIVDIFIINDDQKAVSFRTVFEDSEKTLTSDSIKEFEQKIIQVLEKSGFPLRS